MKNVGRLGCGHHGTCFGLAVHGGELAILELGAIDAQKCGGPQSTMHCGQHAWIQKFFNKWSTRSGRGIVCLHGYRCTCR